MNSISMSARPDAPSGALTATGDGGQRMGFRRFVQARMHALQPCFASFDPASIPAFFGLNNVLSHIGHAPICGWRLWLAPGGRDFGAFPAFFFLSFSLHASFVFSMD
ncbi:hypothetical protein [Prosthecobacter fluviatilis]|uniref:Uncharacterized protein n=1 Tax=Prosthecobacter fluviatilis TaxID=445931 RepID=A0ABW0KXN0_9BACT